MQMAELTQAIVTFELGSAVAAADHYNIREVYSSADQYTPIIFILPTELQGPAWEATQGKFMIWLIVNVHGVIFVRLLCRAWRQVAKSYLDQCCSFMYL